MSILSAYVDITETPTRFAFGWKDDQKSFVVGDREITVAETKYAPPSKAMMIPASKMNVEGSIEEWYDSLYANSPEVNAMKRLAVSLGLASVMMRIVTNDSFVINFYGSYKWRPLLNLINSVFGDPIRLTVRDFDDVSLFKNFPITYIDAERLGTDFMTKFLKPKDRRLISVSSDKIHNYNKRLINIELPDIDEEIVIPKSFGVLVEPFVKLFIKATKFEPFSMTTDFWEDVFRLTMKADSGLKLLDPSKRNVLIAPLLSKFLEDHRNTHSMLIRFINEHLDAVNVSMKKHTYAGHTITPPDKPIKIRYTPDKDLLHIVANDFRKYCMKRGVHPKDVNTGYKAAGIIVGRRAMMLYGSRGNGNNSLLPQCLCINTNELFGFNKEQFLYDQVVRSSSPRRVG